jgi:hypothetical protein
VASYESRDELTVNATAELGRFAPESWGVAMPMTVSYHRTGLDPLFLQGTDIRADRLPGLRDTGSMRRRVGISLRKTTPSSNPWIGAVVDGAAVRINHISMSDNTVTSASRLDGVEAGIDVDRPVADIGFGLMPAFIESVLRWLVPQRIEDSGLFDRLTDARLRLTPERVGFNTTYLSHDARIWRYERVLESPQDLDVTPFDSPRRSLESGARVAFRPLASLSARVGVTTGRDVLNPARATSLDHEQQALRREQARWLGMPIGWERDRMMTTDVAYRPIIADWLRPSMSWTSRFGQRRDQAYLTVVERPGGELDAELQRSFHTDSRWTRGVIFDPAAAVRAALLPPGGEPLPADPEGQAGASDAGDLARAAMAAFGMIKPIELTWSDGLGSRFERELATPGLPYQLGMGRVEHLRIVDGDTAATALFQEAFRARSGIRLGAGAEIGIGYTESDAHGYDRHVGRRDHFDRAWPDIQLSWREIPVPSVLDPVLDRWSFSTGFVRHSRRTTLQGELPRRWERVESTIPVELRLGFTSGLGLSYLTTVTSGDGHDPTGLTEQAVVTHGLDLSGRFVAPFGLAEHRIPEPLRLTLSYHYQAESQCRTAGNQPPPAPCTRFIDHLNRRMNLSVSTLVSQLDVGLQASYVDRRSFIGTQVGSGQFQLGLFGRFNMQAGSFQGR